MWDLPTLHRLNEEACREKPLRDAEVIKRVITAIQHGADTPTTRIITKWRDTQLAQAQA